jgi:hypothetical protein
MTDVTHGSPSDFNPGTHCVTSVNDFAVLLVYLNPDEAIHKRAQLAYYIRIYTRSPRRPFGVSTIP